VDSIFVRGAISIHTDLPLLVRMASPESSSLSIADVSVMYSAKNVLRKDPGPKIASAVLKRGPLFEVNMGAHGRFLL
jgi:hypothetical protein